MLLVPDLRYRTNGSISKARYKMHNTPIGKKTKTKKRDKA
jgi:hypothetical protein